MATKTGFTVFYTYIISSAVSVELEFTPIDESPRLVTEGYNFCYNNGKLHLLLMLKETVTKLTLKAPITTAADDSHKYFSLFFRENKT